GSGFSLTPHADDRDVARAASSKAMSQAVAGSG
ncbi:MAG: hypothetical protein QOI17_1436, partial [Gaiellales bacterium]|nr:hypothetical protein [Gaiellales bacterium]